MSITEFYSLFNPQTSHRRRRLLAEPVMFHVVLGNQHRAPFKVNEIASGTNTADEQDGK